MEYLVSPVMSVDEAREWKSRISATANQLRLLLFEGYERQAWIALGHGTWTECLQALAEEYRFSERRLWQLHAANQTEKVLNPGSVGEIPEKHLRPLTSMEPDEQREVWSLAVETAPAGHVTASHVEAVVHQRQAEKAARLELKRQGEQGPMLPESVTLWHGDFLEQGACIPDGSIDLILTDPPYGETWVPSFEALGAFAARVLKPGGSLLAMYGQMYLFEAWQTLQQHLAYQWVYSYRLHGSGTAVWARHVQNHWKPVLWFVRGTYTGDYQGDVLSSADQPDKLFHDWGQSEDVFALLVKRFTMPGEVICDPLCGGGTTGAVAITLRRKFIGMDRDPEAIAITRARLAALELS